MIVGKYEFNSREQFLDKYDKLHTSDKEGNKVPKFKFAKVELGHITLQKEELDEDGEVISEAVLSECWCVDMAWFLEDEFNEEGELISKDHPYGWKSYSVDIETEGVHGIAGVSYLDNKF